MFPTDRVQAMSRGKQLAWICTFLTHYLSETKLRRFHIHTTPLCLATPSRNASHHNSTRRTKRHSTFFLRHIPRHQRCCNGVFRLRTCSLHLHVFVVAQKMAMASMILPLALRSAVDKNTPTRLVVEKIIRFRDGWHPTKHTTKPISTTTPCEIRR